MKHPAGQAIAASFTHTVRRRLLLALAGTALVAAVLPRLGLAQQANADPQGAPDAFVEAVAENVLEILKRDEQLQAGNVRRINEVVDEHVLPYVDFEKTTRLAAGCYWRDATPAQQQELVQAFRGTLVRTYSGAFRRVSPQTEIAMLPFRGDPNADDVVVRTQVRQPNAQPAAVDYRLERTPQGWRVYDLSVEGIWLIQNYRNQFATTIQQSGVDGLIQALNQRNQ